ncbi:hypothetical protein SOVF_172120 [Spinacia oleracea]|nr:hypothetical protein SOVF_172120 [Spinacia oleracea]
MERKTWTVTRVVATKPHYFLDLDVQLTEKNFLENIPEFWSSEEFSESLKGERDGTSDKSEQDLGEKTATKAKRKRRQNNRKKGEGIEIMMNSVIRTCLTLTIQMINSISSLVLLAGCFLVMAMRLHGAWLIYRNIYQSIV